LFCIFHIPSSTPCNIDADTGKVDLEGYEHYFICVGDGSPTVIHDAGGG